jgi:acyl-CoA synthetase (NDP forming)
MNPEKRQQIDRMLHPRGLALFGGTGGANSFGYRVLQSQVLYGYDGPIYPISNKGGKVDGLKIYKSLSNVDGPVDLVAISVPARAVPGVLRECLKKGVAGVQINSSGFAETGTPEGLALEAEVAEIAAKGLRIVGPNCFGLHSPRGKITLIPGFRFSKESGPLAFISQSGGVASDFGYEARFRGLGLSKVISYGNGCDLEATELLDYLADDPETEIIAAYIEGVRNGRMFLDLLKQVTPKKPVVIWKAGLTPLGSRAVKGHTGSLAGEAEIWKGALTQAGAVAVQGLDEMMDALVALRFLKPSEARIAMLGGGGAIGVFISDLAYRLGLKMPRFSPETQKRLKTYFPAPGNSMANPLDTGTPVLPFKTVLALSREILTREPVDVLIIVLLLQSLEVILPTFMRISGQEPPPGGSYFQGLLQGLVRLKEETHKDLIMVFDNKAYLQEDLEVEGVSRKMQDLYQKAGIPVFPSAERALRGIHLAQRSLGDKPASGS